MTRKTSDAPSLLGDAAGFRRALLSWYRTSRRRLPWREVPSAYGTVVSEFMLQQTQVATVLPYFSRWMEALPDFDALAAAPEAQVLKLWEGLGYYSRARNLHRLARAVRARGALPSDVDGLLELPGIGPYTAAAVASIAFGVPAACVDGNVVRILARLTRDDRSYADGTSAAKALAPLARQLLNPGHPGDHNQAMMELGATLCVKRLPACGACPVRAFCAGALAGDPAAFPKLRKKPTERRSVLRAWCERRGSVLLHRNAPGARRLGGLHELPTPEQAGLDPDVVARGPLFARKSRAITRFRIVESIHEARVPTGKLLPDLVWVRVDELDSVSLSGPHRKWTARILASREDGRGRLLPGPGPISPTP